MVVYDLLENFFGSNIFAATLYPTIVSNSQFIKHGFRNRPFSYSEKESQSNEVCLHFEEFSNVHNTGKKP